MELTIDSKYSTTRHGVTTIVELIKVKKNMVYVRELERQDSFKVPYNKFKEYYVPVAE